jgi:hypothetical protein
VDEQKVSITDRNEGGRAALIMPSRVDTDGESGTTSDSLLANLNGPHFDPVDFLNETLPTLSLSSQSQTAKTSRSTQIQTSSTETLGLLSSLNAINIRSSTELTTLTDEIIRSGNRLAYEVEVLRGDVNGFHELLTEAFREDIAHFVTQEAANQDRAMPKDGENGTPATRSDEPDFMTRLRLLGKVKSRLESVITVFGEAMKWPVPPSEVSGASLIAITAPELGMQSSEEDDKAHEALKRIRNEVADLINSDGGNYAGLEKANARVELYRQLATLWKGTAEEKSRTKFVENLAKMVEDRKKALDARGARNARSDSSARSSSATGRPKGGNEGGGAAAGLFRNLQRLKDDLYLD